MLVGASGSCGGASAGRTLQLSQVDSPSCFSDGPSRYTNALKAPSYIILTC